MKMNNNNKIKDILLQHRGKNNAITSKNVSSIMGFPMEDTQAKSRKEIHKTAEMFNLPLLSCSHGFYIAETEQELEEYNRGIDNRISGIEKNRQIVNENFKRLKNENNYKK